MLLELIGAGLAVIAAPAVFHLIRKKQGLDSSFSKIEQRSTDTRTLQDPESRLSSVNVESAIQKVELEAEAE